MAQGLGVALPGPNPTWRPCLVVSWDSARPWAHPHARRRRAGGSNSLHYVSCWQDTALDASVWGCGSAPLTQLTVREMADRMRVLNIIASPPTGRPYVVGQPIQPKVWEADWSAVDSGDSGIRHVERRWAAAAAGLTHEGGQRGRLRGRDSDGHDGTEAEQQPHVARLHPLQRAAQRVAQEALAAEQALVQPQRQNPPNADDVTDLAERAEQKPPWACVYKRLNQRRIPRRQRWVATQLLHAALPCAAYEHKNNPQRRVESRCLVPACGGRAANLSHIFGDCSVATAVVQWLCNVWSVIEPGNRPPPAFAVIAVGDLDVWRPRAVELWTRVRLQLLYSLWQAAEVATADRPPVAQAVAASVVAGIAAAIRLDWLRATLSAPELAGACGQWMTGSGHAMSPEAAIDQFAALWCVRGVLCQPPASPLHPPVVRWDSAWPVRFPAATLAAAGVSSVPL